MVRPCKHWRPRHNSNSQSFGDCVNRDVPTDDQRRTGAMHISQCNPGCIFYEPTEGAEKQEATE